MMQFSSLDLIYIILNIIYILQKKKFVTILSSTLHLHVSWYHRYCIFDNYIFFEKLEIEMLCFVEIFWEVDTSIMFVDKLCENI